ncbi:bifunctional non-homologous end joining protein LigD [Stackebrandtia endophytica]|uniref:Bifunctional non-homologous end joining protein LigD n=1 Tax=Stackebrandtia endophytica TaxID=1496996 RepID=A0A543AUM9_9ACTN|nr:non-homologous end-joining DNA ligase [Stackebrandtia endophytica]TQL76298.1 bifunctional non-homologous end joining protein LigD [Stackebrandtia endophytica]
MSGDERTEVTIDGERLTLTRPHKVMYPDTGFTKAEVIDYYLTVADHLLPHLADRPVTRIRYPNGTSEMKFYEKNAPKGTPEWVRTENLPTPGSSKGRAFTDFVVVERVATLAWLGNLAALELHTTQWKVEQKEEPRHPDRLVADLDPGEGAGMAECVEVALILRDRLAQDGLTAYPKSSGKKGVHLCCPIAAEQTDGVVSDYARRVAYELSEEYGDLITANMRKIHRTGRVFIDWSQNNAAKTTVAPYSLRNLGSPTVSTPLTWDELQSGMDVAMPPETVVSRLESHGDLWAPLLEPGPRVPED